MTVLNNSSINVLGLSYLHARIPSFDRNDTFRVIDTSALFGLRC